MAKFPIKMPVKQDGKIHPVGTELEFAKAEIKSLTAAGIIDAPSQEPKQEPSGQK